MRDRLERRVIAHLPKWQAADARLKHLALMDSYLDGSIYDSLPYEFDEESLPGKTVPKQVKLHERKPSTRLNAARTISKNVARKLFAGRHAPSLVLEEYPDKVKNIQDYLKQASTNKEMLGLAIKGSIGSVAATFKLVDVDGELHLVLSSHKATECFPVFDAAKQLIKLTIAYEVTGRWFYDQGYRKDFNGDDLEMKGKYFYIRVLDKVSETFFQPITIADWNPVEGPDEKLIPISEGVLQPVAHGLGFVPSQWFVNLSGGTFPDGDCLFEPALDNVIAYDYGMSQIDLGLNNAACPVTVIKGNLVQYEDESGKPITRPASRYIHFEAGVKDPEGISEEGGDAKLLETSGQGFLAKLKQLEQLKKNIAEQASSSRKDPDKVTTAMSGKGIELIEEEFMDLVFELRTCYGEDGFLRLVKKMCLAGIEAGHKLLKGITKEMVSMLDLAWPDLHDMSPQEYQQYVTGIVQGAESNLIDGQQARDLHRAKVDVPTSHASKNSKIKPVGKLTTTTGKKNKSKESS